MPEPKLDTLIQDLLAHLPETLQDCRAELAKHSEGKLQNTLATHGFVARDEFDIQCAALTRIEARLKQLEADMQATKKAKATPSPKSKATSSPKSKTTTAKRSPKKPKTDT